MSSTCFSRRPLCIICWLFEFLNLWKISNFHIECLKFAFWFLLTLNNKKKIWKKVWHIFLFWENFAFWKTEIWGKEVCIQIWLTFLWMGISFQKTVIDTQKFLIICCNKENYIWKGNHENKNFGITLFLLICAYPIGQWILAIQKKK